MNVSYFLSVRLSKFLNSGQNLFCFGMNIPFSGMSLRGEAEAIQKQRGKNWIAASACRPPRNDEKWILAFAVRGIIVCLPDLRRGSPWRPGFRII
jgi:hypothetical protein